MARKYQLTRIGAGDYILPNNEGTRIHRIAKEERDGWGVWQYHLTVAKMGDDDLPDDFLDWGNWELRSSFHPKREDAINWLTGPPLPEKFTGPKLSTDAHGRTTIRLW